MTVRRHIQSLSYRYPIETFCGGINRGGVYLDKDYVYQGSTLTNDELQLINNALLLLQKQGVGVDKNLLDSLLEKFSLPKARRIENGK